MGADPTSFRSAGVAEDRFGAGAHSGATSGRISTSSITSTASSIISQIIRRAAAAAAEHHPGTKVDLGAEGLFPALIGLVLNSPGASSHLHYIRQLKENVIDGEGVALELERLELPRAVVVDEFKVVAT